MSADRQEIQRERGKGEDTKAKRIQRKGAKNYHRTGVYVPNVTHLQKVFRALDLFHILLCYSLNSK
jgi:hypothetical protein